MKSLGAKDIVGGQRGRFACQGGRVRPRGRADSHPWLPNAQPAPGQGPGKDTGAWVVQRVVRVANVVSR